jgi:hypothetical protein
MDLIKATVGQLIAKLADATSLGAEDIRTDAFPYRTPGRSGMDIAKILGVTIAREHHYKALRAAYQAGRAHVHWGRVN